MKKKVAVVVVSVVCFGLFIVSSLMSAEFWASKVSNKYHYPSCEWAQKIKPENLVKFSSPEQAQKDGYIPCKVCAPPTSAR